MSETIYPTGTCFDDAAEFLETLARNGVPFSEYRLCHGIMVNKVDGHRFAHAWVELGDVVFFCGILDGKRDYFSARKEEYYADGHVEQVTRYTPQEVLRENLKHRTYGPWKPEYLELCSRCHAERGGQ